MEIETAVSIAFQSIKTAVGNHDPYVGDRQELYLYTVHGFAIPFFIVYQIGAGISATRLAIN